MYDPEKVPDRVKEVLQQYVKYRTPTGDFLRAVLQNDLKMAVWRADEENLAALKHIVSYCHWEIPGNCWGSPENVRNWLERRNA